MELSKLKDAFPENDIEWRVQRSGVKNNKTWAMVLAYVTNRAIMDRLDDVCGPENWKNIFDTGPGGGVICGISIKCGDEWVTKWDGADNTQVEAIKGGLSAAMKRAGSQWGIGRYLYNLDTGFATINDNGRLNGQAKDGGATIYFKYDPPVLPKWALPPAEDKPDKSYTKIMSSFAAIKAELMAFPTGEKDYYAGLKIHDLEHANSTKDVVKLRDCYKNLAARLKVLKGGKVTE